METPTQFEPMIGPPYADDLQFIVDGCYLDTFQINLFQLIPPFFNNYCLTCDKPKLIAFQKSYRIAVIFHITVIFIGFCKLNIKSKDILVAVT